MSIVIKAAQFARAAHAGQFRDRPLATGYKFQYETHVCRVAGRIALLEGATEEDIAIGYLHDVIEDCGVTYEILQHLFGDYISAGVWWLTSKSKQTEYNARRRKESYSSPSRASRKEADRNYLRTAPNMFKKIKLIDRNDNLRDTLMDADAAWALNYVRESEALYKAALNGIDNVLEAEFFALCDSIEAKYKEK